MAEIKKAVALVRTREELAEGIFSMWLEEREIAEHSVPGQFLSVYCKDAGRLLPRPISICEIDRAAGTVRIVFRMAGAGTKELSGYKAGEELEIMGPLGIGYHTENINKAILIGGGIGIPPLLALAKELTCEKIIVLGYRDSTMFLKDEFEKYGRIIISTEDGSVGTKGNVIDAINACKADGMISDDCNREITIFSCGPTPMLRGVKAYAINNGIPAQLSLEERMACGIGACLACVCKSTEIDHHSHVHNKRVCKDGPVFWAEEIEL